MRRKLIYGVVAVDVLYIGALVVCVFLIGRLDPPDFTAMRNKIEASSSLEDLRPRALHAISAIESADTAIGRLHDVATRLTTIGIALAAVNLSLLCFVARSIPRV